jgi:hypothetical protein
MALIYMHDPNTGEQMEVGKDGPLPVEITNTELFRVYGSAAIVDVELSVEASSLDANDVVAATQELLDFSKVPSGCVELRSIQVIDADDQKAEIYIVFFDAPVALGVEDAAVTLSDVGARNYLGHVLVAAADYADFVGVSVACKRDLGLMLQSMPGSRSVYIAVWTTGTPTYASGILRLRLGLIRY